MWVCSCIASGWFHTTTAEMSSATETARPTKPEGFITWPSAEKVCQPLLQSNRFKLPDWKYTFKDLERFLIHAQERKCLTVRTQRIVQSYPYYLPLASIMCLMMNFVIEIVTKIHLINKFPLVNKRKKHHLQEETACSQDPSPKTMSESVHPVGMHELASERFPLP